MKLRRSIRTFSETLVLFLSLLVTSTIALAEDKPTTPAKPATAAAKPATAPAGMPSQEETNKAWMAFATPGPAHKALEGFAGSWVVKAKTWMVPGAPPAESEGSAEQKMILGGRYLEQRYEGTMMGGPFSGIGTTGFDNYKKKFVSTWVDSMGTGIMTMSGTFDKAGKVITSWGTMDDPAEKRTMKVKSAVTLVDADHHTYESWHAAPDGKMIKDLEIHYTRKK
jgi:hypothetical protein